MSRLSIGPDGRLFSRTQARQNVFPADQAQIWSVAARARWVALPGHREPRPSDRKGGRLRQQVSRLEFHDQPEIFAVAVDRAGIVYAGTSPDGKVYRIENGKATEYFAPGERYIWALAFAPDGALYVATGQQGKIFQE